MKNPNKPTQYYDVPNEPVSEGVIMEGVLSHYVSPKTAISYAENMNNDTIGLMTSRRPLVSRITPAANVLSCALLAPSVGVPTIVWQEGSTWRATTAPVAGTPNDTASILDSTVPARYDIYGGAILSTPPGGTGQLAYTYQPLTTDPVEIPGTAFPIRMGVISAGFDQRIWMADVLDNNCKLYYTDPIALATGVQSATGGNGFLVVPAESGDMITGLIKTQRCLYVFTHNNIFQVFNTSTLDNAPVSYVGAYSQEGIVRAKNGFYFYHPTGVFFLQPGGQPQEISVKVRDIIRKVNAQYQIKVFGWSDEDHVTFCLGNKLQGYQPNKTYYIRYTISTQVWTIYSTLNFLPSCADSINPQMNTGGSSSDYQGDETVFPLTYVFGNATDTNGDITTTRYGGTFNVFTPSTENSSITPDWGTIPIPVEFQTNWMTFDIEEHAKRANGLFIPAENAADLKVAYQIDGDLPNVWRPIGNMSNEYITSFNSWQSDNFHRIKFRIYGQTNGKTLKVAMPTIRVLDDLGYDSN